MSAISFEKNATDLFKETDLSKIIEDYIKNNNCNYCGCSFNYPSENFIVHYLKIYNISKTFFLYVIHAYHENCYSNAEIKFPCFTCKKELTTFTSRKCGTFAYMLLLSQSNAS